MTKMVLDAELESRLRGFAEAVEFCDRSGHVIGYFHPAAREQQLLRDISPFSDEDIQQLRGQTGGRPLQDILRELSAS